ncbi:MAG: tetratricopeptide repeat protein, partial [Anaerolinea sp.]|nr:tetratricopeptide repeat protein [Anaerolinea sp.]
YEAALADLDRAIELDEKEAWAIANRGETYRLMGNYEAALADFDRAINLYGKYPRVIWIIINRVFGMGRRYAYAIAHRGVTYRLMGNYEAALADFDRAIELDENDWYCYDRSIVYLAKSRLNAAEKDLQRAITLAKQKYQNEPGNWNNTLNLALYRLAAGQTADAERLYRESADAPAGFIREAILDLEYFLAVLPEHEQAIAMRNYLLSRVQKG